MNGRSYVIVMAYTFFFTLLGASYKLKAPFQWWLSLKISLVRDSSLFLWSRKWTNNPPKSSKTVIQTGALQLRGYTLDDAAQYPNATQPVNYCLSWNRPLWMCRFLHATWLAKGHMHIPVFVSELLVCLCGRAEPSESSPNTWHNNQLKHGIVKQSTADTVFIFSKSMFWHVAWSSSVIRHYALSLCLDTCRKFIAIMS